MGRGEGQGVLPEGPFPSLCRLEKIVDGLTGLGHELDEFFADGDMRGVFGVGLEPFGVVMRGLRR